MAKLLRGILRTKTFETLFPMLKYYTPERPSLLFSPYGIMTFYEVVPIVSLVIGASVAEIIYFTVYFPWSRGEVLYTKNPAYKSVDLEKPPIWRFMHFNCYKKYKPLVDIKNTLNAMSCEELERIKEYKQNDLDYKKLGITKPQCKKSQV